VSRSTPPYEPPDFNLHSALIERADRYAFAAHEGGRSVGATRIEHPRAVAALLADRGVNDEIVAAALLHDVLEDTSVTRDELQREFGVRVADLVAHLTEDASIEPYAERKAQLRQQVTSGGPDAAAVFLADKLARLQALNRSGDAIAHSKLEHYRATLELLARAYPQAPLIPEVSRALAEATAGQRDEHPE
jgi:(p)ppGpp synthase/HD superfamily hydrolase